MPIQRYHPNQQMMDRATSDLITERLIPDVPRWRGFRTGFVRCHPLIVYSAFVTVSLLLLGGMAVASLPN